MVNLLCFSLAVFGHFLTFLEVGGEKLRSRTTSAPLKLKLGLSLAKIDKQQDFAKLCLYLAIPN